MLDESLTKDILKEIFNISVGKAAEMLSDITNKRIILDVPEIAITSMGDGNGDLNNHLSTIPEGALMVSSIDFDTNLKGEANLIFPAKKMRSFINLCIDQVDEDAEEYTNEEIDFTDMDFDIIKEVGNIILNSIVGGMGNILDINLQYTIPQVRLFNKDNFKSNVKNIEYECALILYISFIIEHKEIEGAIIIDLTLNSLNELMRKIKKVEEDLYG